LPPEIRKSKPGRRVQTRRFGCTVSYFAGNKRCWKMLFADFKEAHREAKSKADAPLGKTRCKKQREGSLAGEAVKLFQVIKRDWPLGCLQPQPAWS
jgi:hypothetical protein